MDPHLSPAELVAQSRGLLLDFDGPLCNVYAGTNPAKIAASLAYEFGLNIETNDPLDLIREAIRIDGPIESIHQSVTLAEVQAVQSATETAHVRRLIRTYEGSVAIVSNNSTEAIDDWLRRVGLISMVDHIAGRNPRHMKPDPLPLINASAGISRQLSSCVFVGDSISDAHAAQRAGCPMIAFANKTRKFVEFATVDCEAVVASLRELIVT